MENYIYSISNTLLAKAIIQFPRFDSDWLIAKVSFNRLPSEPDSFKRSEPAKSTKFRVPGRKGEHEWQNHLKQYISTIILRTLFPVSIKIP